MSGRESHDFSRGRDVNTYSDPTGLDAMTASAPTDLLTLVHSAMEIPAFAQIVAMPQVRLPGAGTIYNLDADLGHDGISGIKVGSDSAAGGCFAFAAKRDVEGRNILLLGVVLDQRGYSPSGTALSVASALVDPAFASAIASPPLPANTVVARLRALWGPSTTLAVAGPVPVVVSWPAMVVSVSVHFGRMPSSVASHTWLGSLQVSIGDQRFSLPVQTTSSIPRPSVAWRLTRL